MWIQRSPFKSEHNFPGGRWDSTKKCVFGTCGIACHETFAYTVTFLPSIVGTLRRFEDVFNQGTIILRRAIQVLSDQPAVSSLDETRKDPSFSLPSPNLLIRTTIGITSATPPAMVPECNDAANACERCNNATLRLD